MNDRLEVLEACQLAKECESINRFERELMKHPEPPPCPLKHVFTQGLYARHIFLPAGLQCTSKIHKTEHQFIVSHGLFEMWSSETGWVRINAMTKPYHGITKPGTRRAFKIIKGTYFSTFHPTELTDLKEIEAELIEPHDIPTREKNLS